MDGMMNGAMMWGMGLVGVLVIIVLVLSAAALLKYLFLSDRKWSNGFPSRGRLCDRPLLRVSGASWHMN